MNHKIISAASVPSRTESRTGQRGITETGLKWIALVSMLMDHIYYFFGYTNLIPWWFGLAGRLAAPLFLFCLVEGFFHTGSRKRYFFKILCIAVPMGLLHFFMRFGNVFVRPDGFYPQNAMLSSFLIQIELVFLRYKLELQLVIIKHRLSCKGIIDRLVPIKEPAVLMVFRIQC